MTKIQLRIREIDSRVETKRVPSEERLCGSNQHSSVDQCLSKIVTEVVSVGTSFLSTPFCVTWLQILFLVAFGGRLFCLLSSVNLFNTWLSRLLF